MYMREISNAPKGKRKKRKFYQGVACAGLNTDIHKTRARLEPGEKVQRSGASVFFFCFFLFIFLLILFILLLIFDVDYDHPIGPLNTQMGLSKIGLHRRTFRALKGQRVFRTDSRRQG